MIIDAIVEAVFRKDMNAGEYLGHLNITSRSRDPRARLLSALANRPFQFREFEPLPRDQTQWFASLEGWYQGIKFPPNDPRRYEAFASCFGHAKAFSAWAERKYVWWAGERLHYAGPLHKELIESAFRASFFPSSERELALIQTADLVLVHETGEQDAEDSPLTKAEFAQLLMRIRKEILDAVEEERRG